MVHKALHVSVIVLLVTGVASAQAQMPTPGVHLEDKNPSRTKEQKEYDKALDRVYQSTIKKIPDTEKKSVDPWGNIRPAPPVAAKTKQQ